MLAPLPLLLLAGCGPVQVLFGPDEGAGALRADPVEVVAGVVFVDERRSFPLEIRNVGGIALEGAVEAADGPEGRVEVSAATLSVGPGDAVAVDVTVEGVAAGALSEVLTWTDTRGEVLLAVPVGAEIQRDDDGDGFGSLATGGEDCDDGDARVHPDAEDAPYDGVDADCAGDDDYDADQDGVRVGDDCDDEDPEVGREAIETWNGVDDDCDGIIDDLRVDEMRHTRFDGSAAGGGLGGPGTLSVGTDPEDGGFAVLATWIGVPGAAFRLPGASLTVPGDVGVEDAAAGTVTGSDDLPLGVLTQRQVDVDGDDHPDLLVGARIGGLGDWHPGRVWLVGADRGLGGDGAVDALAESVWTGDTGRDSASVAAAGDFDGDGVTDVAVGAPLDERGSHGESPDAGTVAIFPGPHPGGAHDLSEAAVLLHGSREGHWLGFALAAGDLDADGLDDLLAGAPGDGTGAPGAGAVSWLRGGTLGAGVQDVSDVATARYVSSHQGAGLGSTTLAPPGDVDGDGALDLLLGAPFDGTASLWPQAGSVTGLHIFEDAPMVVLTPGDQCGTAVLADTDLTADGVADVLVGCPAALDGHGAPGSVLVFDGRERGGVTVGEAVGVIFGEGAADLFGAALAGGLDLDGAGGAELLVGAPGTDSRGNGAGSVYVLDVGELGR